MNPKVSIIIPVYNSEKYLHRCFDSILANKYSNLEIIPINDGSKDNSQKIINEYKQKYPEIFFPISQSNQGIGMARNNAMKNATGDYIMFIDNDDFIDEDYIITHINQLKENDYDIIISGYKRVTDNKVQYKVKLKEKYPWTRYNSIAPWGKLYKRKFLMDNDIKFPKIPIGEDVYFNLQANTLTDKVKIIEYIGYNWYQNSISVTNTIDKKIKGIDIIKLLDSHYNILKEKNSIKKENEDIIALYFILLIIQFLQWLSKGLTYKEISDYYDSFFKWINKNFPNYKKIKYWKITKGERFKVRLIIFIFMSFNKIHLTKFCIYIYGKYKERFEK